MWLHLENKIYTVKTQVLTPKPYQTLIFITYPNLSYVREAQFKSCHTKKHGSTSRRLTCLTKISHAGRRVTPVLSQLPLSLVIRQTSEDEDWFQNDRSSFVFWLVDWWPDFPLSFGLCSSSNNFR